jgi:hypothetical protein
MYAGKCLIYSQIHLIPIHQTQCSIESISDSDWSLAQNTETVPLPVVLMFDRVEEVGYWSELLSVLIHPRMSMYSDPDGR